ncbi:MAG: hypothetical protein K9L82_16970 [Chromatiaceae bacterium]|nr:hypothetical protein [Chromatiaceae bacterium]
MFARYKKEVRDDLIRKGLLEPKGKQRQLAEPEDITRAKTVAKRADIDEKTLGKPIQLMSQIDRMLGICDMLDRDAIDEESGKLRDTGDAREAVKVRTSVLKLAVDAQSTIFDTNRIHRVHSIMFSRIAEADPEIARRIVDDLEAVDREYGIGLQ